jgi:hypothetical protein
MSPWQKKVDEWISLAARICGLVGLVVFGIVWIQTQRVEPVLVAAAGTLYGIGKGQQALATLRQAPPTPPPVPDSSTTPVRQEDP